MALGMVGKRWHRHAEQAGAIAAAILLFVTFGPAIALFEELMSGGPIWMFAPLGALVMLPVLIELRPAFGRPSALFVAAGALDLFILGWVVAGFTPAYSVDRQQRFTVEYVLDDRGSAEFAVNNDGAAIPFQADWARRDVVYATSRRWVARAPAPDAAVRGQLRSPQLIPLGGRQAGTRYYFRVRIAMNGAEQFVLALPSDTEVAGAGLPGASQDFSPRPGNRFIRCVGRSCDGAEIELALSNPQEIGGEVIGIRSGLPPQAAALARARPALARPQYSPDSTISYSHVTFDQATVARPAS
jgi:hypothetical protein